MKAGKYIRSIVRILIFAVMGVMVGYSIYMINARVVGRNPLPMPFRYGQAVVTSGSMSPAFEVDALLIYHEQEKYEIGDMVAFMDEDGNLITHRIIQMTGNEVITQGDANTVMDNPIKKEQIYGKVIHTIPHVGKIVRLLQKPGVIIVLIILFLAGLEWNYRQSKRAALRNLEAQRQEIRKLRGELKE